MSSSQSFPDGIKQQLASSREEKERKEEKIEELVTKRERLEAELRQAKPEGRADIQTSIERVEKDIEDRRKDLHELNAQIKVLLGECGLFGGRKW